MSRTSGSEDSAAAASASSPPGLASNPEERVAGASHRPDEAPTPPPEQGLRLDPVRDLAIIAARASSVLLLASLCNLLIGLFPLRLADGQWQLNQMANLAANGFWILLGVVLLHLAVQQQPSRARWLKRLIALRRLMAPLALLYLLVVPLQLGIIGWGISVARSDTTITLKSTLTRTGLIRAAIVQATDLSDLERRVKAIPGSPPIPREAAGLPFPVLKSTLVGQIDSLASRVRDQLYGGNRKREQIERDLWLGGLRSALTNLFLAFAFASASGDSAETAPLIQLMRGLPRGLRRLAGSLRRGPSRKRRQDKGSVGGTSASLGGIAHGMAHGSDDGIDRGVDDGVDAAVGAAVDQGNASGSHGRRGRRRRSRAGGVAGASQAQAPAGALPTEPREQPTTDRRRRQREPFGERWQRWKRRLRE